MKNNRNFFQLMLGQSLANIGDVLYIVSVISYIYHVTQSAAASSLVPFVITVSMFISSILTPLLSGKYKLKTLLVGSQIGKTAVLIALSLFMMTEMATANYYLIFITIAGIAFLDGCANPIRQTLIPYYVEENVLIWANGIAETITQSVQIGTWFFGALLLILFHPTQLIWFVVVLFIFSSLILTGIEEVGHKTENKEKNWTLFTQGWRTILDKPILKAMAQIEFFDTIASSVWIAAIVIVFVKEALHVQEQWWGFINSSFFVGLVIGSALCVAFHQFVNRHLYIVIMIGTFFTLTFTFLFSLTSSPVFALMISALIGLFGQLKNIPQQTITQTSIPKEELASVYASFGTIATGTFGISSLLMGVLSDYLGVRSVFALSALLLTIVFLITWKKRRLFVNTTTGRVGNGMQ